MGHEKIIGLNVVSIHPKLKERKSSPAATMSNPNRTPLDLTRVDVEDEEAFVSIRKILSVCEKILKKMRVMPYCLPRQILSLTNYLQQR